jgi:hypothetical protein
MATQTVHQQIGQVTRAQDFDAKNRAKNVVHGIVEAVTPIFGPWRLEYLDRSNPAGISPLERAKIDSDLLR